MSREINHSVVKANFYPSKEECLEAERTVINTNPRYKNFCQFHFTAGDVEQFQEYRKKETFSLDTTFDREKKSDTESTFPPESIFIPDFPKYKNLDCLSVDNTFNYLFHKFKKGIYMKVSKNGLTFLPFSKKNYENEWSDKIKVRPDMVTFVKSIYDMENRPCNINILSKSINRFQDRWYANNGLLRYEFPIHEGDTNDPILDDMFQTLVRERGWDLSDIEFFLNRRDFPIIKLDGTEPYNHIFGNDTKLLSHNYKNYSPILSMVTKKGFADIPIPTGEDWSRVCRKEGKFFPKTCKREYDIKNIPWKNRKSVAVFRGSSTGIGVTIETNKRLKLVSMGKNNPLLDVGITSWNLRPRKIEGDSYLKSINIKSLPFSLSEPLTPQEQCEYKYIINVEGHVCAFRLSLELEMGCCILLVESDYKLWYSHLLKPYEHYVPVKSDLSDLLEKVEWCKAHDMKCKKIAYNARKFSSLYLTKEGILNYLETLLIKLKGIVGNYSYPTFSFLDKQMEQEVQYLKYLKYRISSKESLIFSNKKTKIYKDDNKVRKESEESLIHEAFISTFVTNNFPQNFPKILGYGCNETDTQNNFILSEYIQGTSMNLFIKSKEFSIHNFLSILFQLSLTLEEIRNKTGFVHHDLYPWNVMIVNCNQSRTYEINGIVYTINHHLKPVIIDMGRSHAVYENIHYGITDPFSVDPLKDVITFLNSSLYGICANEVPFTMQRHLITLANFISGTEYRKEKFSSIGELRYFFGKMKKYSEVENIKSEKIGNKTTLDFINYIKTNFETLTQAKIKVNKNKIKPVINLPKLSYDEKIFLFPEKVKELKDLSSNIDKKLLEKDEYDILIANIKTLSLYTESETGYVSD
jgi:hypothetical protein